MKVMFVTSEATPYIKSGGLADVLGSLPKALVEQGIECSVVLPKYRDMKDLESLEFVCNYDIFISWRKEYCGVFKSEQNGVTYYFIDNEKYFDRPGLYSYDDDYERFAFFNFAVLELISHLNIKPDILHLHDWQAAMVAVLYKERYCYYEYYSSIRIVFTIHNIAYQGKADPKLINDLYGLSDHLYYNGNLRHDNCFNMMKSAILYSDMITTVSPTYAEEILTDEFGEGLQGILRLKQDRLIGILNGIDYDVYNPISDPNIPYHFNKDNVFEEKIKNKLALQSELGLPEKENIPLIGIVTRLTWQKGIDLLLNKMYELCLHDLQIVILGAGDGRYEEAFKPYAYEYPDKISLNLKYDFGLSCRIYAGCDLFLMPSLFEPCGLSQMMSLRYGTIPIVRETGGLKDSVIPYNEYEMYGTGFSFSHYNAEEMMATIDYALATYHRHEHWKAIVEQAMEAKLDWENSAEEYINMYHWVVSE